MYIMGSTRPDISYAVNYLSRFQSCYDQTHFKHAKRVLRYLKKTRDYKLVFEGNKCDDPVEVYSDADFAGDNTDRKSTSGLLITLFGDTICWSTRKQPIVALSSAESEYVALSDASRELSWFKGLVEDFEIKITSPIPIFEDNQSAIAMIKNPLMTKRSKHIDVRFHFVKEMFDKGLINVIYLSSDSQKADIFTKALGKQKFECFRNILNLRL